MFLESFVIPIIRELHLNIHWSLCIIDPWLFFAHLILSLKCPERMIGVTFPLDLRQQVLLALKKVWMLKNLLMTAFYLGFMEIVHIQLPDEWWKIVVLKVLGKDVVAELSGLLDCKAISFLGPGHNILSQRIVDDLEQFDKERGNMVNRLTIVIKLKVAIFLYVYRHTVCFVGPPARRLLVVRRLSVSCTLVAGGHAVQIWWLLPFGQLRLRLNINLRFVLFIEHWSLFNGAGLFYKKVKTS